MLSSKRERESAVPGLMAGLAVFWVFLFVPFLAPLRSTLFSVWFAYAVVWLAYGMRLIQSALIVVWITGNVLTGAHAWDPYPFILLNLSAEQRRVREAVGSDFIITYRLSMIDLVPGGNTWASWRRKSRCTLALPSIRTW